MPPQAWISFTHARDRLGLRKGRDPSVAQEIEEDMRLKNVMSRRVKCVRPVEKLENASKKMGLNGVHHLVVMDRGKVRGLLTDSILRTRIAEGVARVEDAMVRQIAIGTPETSISEAAQMMRGRPDGALVVFDGKRLAGIVTISDLLDVLGRRTKLRRTGVAK